VRCPKCSEHKSRVINSRQGREGREVRRRRHCEECGHRFTTRERLDEKFPKIAKRDGRREEYARGKLEGGIQKSCVKRRVSEEAIQRLVERVERRLAEGGEAEVASDALGGFVLDELRALDLVAASRFASVFRDFKSAADYESFFAAQAEAAGPEQSAEPPQSAEPAESAESADSPEPAEPPER